MTEEELKKNVEKFLELLRNIAPVLYTIELFNAKYLKDMAKDQRPNQVYGEIHITEYIREGKIVRIEAYPKESRKIEPA